jgi:IS5 family transposase
MRNALAHAGKTQRRMVSAAIGTVFVQPDATTLLKFRRLLQTHDLTQAMFAQIKAYLRERGLLIADWRTNCTNKVQLCKKRFIMARCTDAKLTTRASGRPGQYGGCGWHRFCITKGRRRAVECALR